MTAVPNPRTATVRDALGGVDLAAVADAWDEGFEAGAEWVANNPSPSGIPHDPPGNPHDQSTALLDALTAVVTDLCDQAAAGALAKVAAAVRAVHTPTSATGEPCASEVWSWDHFRPQQVDAYWIRCTRSGGHDEHEDGGNTGLTWPVTDDDPTPHGEVCDADDEEWPCETESRLRAALADPEGAGQ